MAGDRWGMLFSPASPRFRDLQNNPPYDRRQSQVEDKFANDHCRVTSAEDYVVIDRGSAIPAKPTVEGAADSRPLSTSERQSRQQNSEPEQRQHSRMPLEANNPTIAFNEPLRPESSGGSRRDEKHVRARSRSAAPCRRCWRLYNNHKQLKRKRDKVLTMRERVDRERQGLVQCREEVMALRSGFRKARKRSTLEKSPATDLAKLDRLFEKLRRAFEDLEEQEELVRGLENKLGSLEYHMGAKESKLYDNAFLTGTDAAVDYETEPTGIDSDQESHDCSETLPSLVERYYDRAGDIPIYLEQLQEFEIEHRQEREARDVARRRNKQPTPPEREFLENYFNERVTLIRQYLQAKHDAAKLHKQCLDGGYELEEGSDEENEGQLDQMNRAKKDLLHDRSKPNLTDLQYGGGSIPLEMLLFREQQTPAQRIEEWLRDTMRANTTRTSPWDDEDRAASEGVPEPAEPTYPAPPVALTDDGPRSFIAWLDRSPSQRQSLDTPADRVMAWLGEERLDRRHSEPYIPVLVPLPKHYLVVPKSDIRAQSTV